MGKYGHTALLATKLIQDGEVSSPNEVWANVASKVFQNKSSRDKSCPKGAYLNLCESRVIVGIPAGTYCRSKKNIKYAIKAIGVLKKSPAMS